MTGLEEPAATHLQVIRGERRAVNPRRRYKTAERATSIGSKLVPCRINLMRRILTFSKKVGQRISRS
jgi:hypothetical protein